MGQVRISDIITSEYSDFLSYCSSSGKNFISDLTKVDFVAFRTISGQTREYIEKIKTMLTNPVFVSDDIKEPNSETTQADCETEVPVDSAEDKSDYFYVEEAVDANKRSDKADADIFSEDKETMSSAEHIELFSFEISPSESQYTLAQLFDVDVSLFDNIGIIELNLGRRAYNCMNKEGITTVAGVLSKTVDELQLIRNMGEKSIREIFQKTKEFVSYFLSDSDNLSMSYRRNKNKDNRLAPEIKNAVEAILLGDEYSFDNIEEDKLNDLAKIKEAVEISGAEICLDTYLKPDYSAAISVALLEFAKPYIDYCNAKREAAQKMAYLSESICHLNVVPFICAYSATKRNDEIVLMLSECDYNTKVKDIPFLIEKVRQDKSMITLAAEINRLLKWLNFDVAALTSNITEGMFSSFYGENERALEAFMLRSKGKTLSDAGTLFGITRERVRQICNKVHTKFWELYRWQKYDLIMLVYALKQKGRILFFDDLKEILGDKFAEILWHCLKYKPKHDFYFYSREFEAIVINENKAEHYSEDMLCSKIEDLLASLPEVIEIHDEDEILTYLANLAANNSVPITLLKNKFDKIYKRTNSFYYRGRITNAFMYEYVFKNRFRAGYKIADAYDGERFMRYMTEIFGENAKDNGATLRAIEARVCKIGVLCDRAKYIHQDYVQVDKKLIDRINDYIETSPRSILFYSEIFKAMESELEGSQITNKYFLQGALKKYGCKYDTSRDCIRKVSDITFEDELEEFMEERGIVHKSEILAEFQFWTDSELYEIMRKSANVFN